MVFPPQPSDSLMLVSWPCPEGHFSIFSAIQAYFSRTFHLAVDSLGLRRNGPSSEIINQTQDFWNNSLGTATSAIWDVT